MFTGIIEAVGSISALQPSAGDLRLHVATGSLGIADLALGESIAVNGVCLTVVAFSAEHFEADVSNETLRCTTLGALQPGSKVNLERAMRADGRFGGHIVSGHVDGVGEVQSITSESRSQIWRFRVPEILSRYIAEKGSVCIDGTSLTVNAVESNEFEVNLVPHTLANTRFHALSIGARVNIEVDLIARYVERLRHAGTAMSR
ncbi:MAG: Riboflavin synthase [Alphaproteobacteria bacterium ADurb.BinA280]|jgi:riboflavin synthase|nr:riboflavin synthase [Xanthomonadales bacterium]MCC6507364.1 riboflavin synthase [Aquimonas sp.]OPZ11028.1 MAG: Riboflavin synthase [Alphaproteobacteria bacterium ADurb.BinA280]